MKLILLIIFYSFTATAEVSLQDCLDDARTFANHQHPVDPLPECADIINSEAAKVEVVSADSSYRAFAKGHMLYLDKRDGSGNVLTRELLAGDQTELVQIQKIFIDVTARKLYIVQASSEHHELMVYNLDFIGNVTPLNVMRATTLLTGVTSIKAEGADKIEIVNPAGSFRINADAETRTSRSIQKAVVITPK